MRKRMFIMMCLALVCCGLANAQRFTDKLDRGLVAVQTGSSGNSSTNLVSWRRLADEYYDVTYNVYKNGTKVASNLTTTCYNDNNKGYATTQYQVAAVVRGKEQAKCTAVTPWNQYVYAISGRRCATGYLDIALAPVYDRDGNDVTANYSPNDAEMADLDGDGQLEIIIKRLNTVDASVSELYGEMYSTKSNQFVVVDAYDVNWQTGAATMLWRIDCGPNMVSLNSTELNVIAYDWDEDGKAEVVMRGADNMIVYGSDGKTQLFTIGDMSVNTRSEMTSHTNSQYAWTKTGAEYLIYINGQTGAKYQVVEYPLKRLESSETDLNAAWGDNYGHRSTKHFLGAPFLDGRKASLFLGRGIYTRHKMIAMDLDRGSHQWKERWRWNCNDKNSPWYGNGYHNYVIADVDEDGRDEIVYGSMVIDDNGRGLSTTGYEHGDAQHVGDFDPYRKGLEFFGCLEDGPFYGCDYRNATTSEVYFKHTGTDDDGRALMGNFSNNYPGSQGRSVGSQVISSLTGQTIPDYEGNADGFIGWGNLNFRIYWDGDLCSEILNSPGTAREASVEKPGTGRLFTSSGCNMNNDSKNNPCFQGDIIGDWREEIVVRCGTNLRVYVSGMGTSYSMPCLWTDHQYRQAMVWQMMAYNQPPHLSYFLGEMEGITVAPPSLTNEGRTEVANGGVINTTNDHLLLAETNDMTVSVADGAAPYMLTVNTPTWVQGTDVDGTTGTKVKTDGSVGVTNLPEIKTTTYVHTLTGGAFTGAMRLIKQGDGTLVLPNVTETYTGETNVWGGTLQFDGTLQSSPLWLNRFTTLVSNGGTFGGGITMEYAAQLQPGGAEALGTITTTKLTMNMGARLVLDVYPYSKCDQLNADELAINTVDWELGPEYLTPVLQIVDHSNGSLPDCTYVLGNIGTVTGGIENLVIEGLDGTDYRLKYDNGRLLLVIGTGITKICPAAEIAETGETTLTDGYLLPTVGITVPLYTVAEGEEATPVLSAIFADKQGNESPVSLYTSLFKEDYEAAEGTGDWTGQYVTFELVKADAVYGNYMKLSQGGGNGPRSAYKKFSYTNHDNYMIEFDAYFHYAHGNYGNNELIIFGNGASMSASNSMFSSRNYLFKLTGGANYGKTYTVEGSGHSFTFTDAAWYHYQVFVDADSKHVSYFITDASGNQIDMGSYLITSDAVNMYAQGMEIGLGRAYSHAGIDNVSVFCTNNLTYTFTKPGTLTVTSSYPGSQPAETAYEAKGILVLDETATVAPLALDEADVLVNRTIKGNEWSTICLPFAMTSAQVKAAFGVGVQLADFTGYETQQNAQGEVTGISVKFNTDVTAIEANHPYLIQTEGDIDSFTANAVVLAPADLPVLKAGKGSFVGSFVSGTIPEYGLFLNGNKFWYSQGKSRLKAFRGYFDFEDVLSSVANAQTRIVMSFDDEATGIAAFPVTDERQTEVYDLQGRRVQHAARGIYIKGGKKQIVK